jgi:hypothetical protein
MNNYEKKLHTKELVNWFKSKVNDNEWTLFTCTVVFKPIDLNNSQARWEDEYKTRVLRKIRRRLESNQKAQEHAIPYEECFFFERYEKSRFKQTRKRCPFHVHSLLPIRSNQVHRIWSIEEDELNARVRKDIESIDVVQDVLIERVRKENPFLWIRYISKEKEF